jgi:EpsI family protein
MLLLFWIGSYWREDDTPAPQAGAQISPAPLQSRAPALALVALLVLLGAALWPAYARWLDARPLPVMPALQVEEQGGWERSAAFTDWLPHWVGADRQLRASYTQAGRSVFLELNYYATQRQDAELINSQNFMIKQKDPAWSNVGEASVAVEIGGAARTVRQAKMRGRDGQRLLVWQWNLINQEAVVNDHLAKLVLALDRVRLRRDDGLSVLIATPYDDGRIADAEATLARFAADMGPALGASLDRVDGK